MPGRVVGGTCVRERQLRRALRQIQTDLGMKGSSSLTPRMLLERLIILLARPAPARRA